MSDKTELVESKNTPETEEQYSLSDDRRVKVLSPGTLVAKRFFRNRLAVRGLIMTPSPCFCCCKGTSVPQEKRFFRDAGSPLGKVGFRQGRL